MKLQWTSLGMIALVGCSDPVAPPVTTDVPVATDVAVTDVGNPVDSGNPTDSGTPTDRGNPVDLGNTADAGTDAGTTGDVPVATDVLVMGDAGSSGVVINEIHASGDDWVELKNVGTASVDLSGLVLADTDTDVDGGAPRLGDGMTFPAGTMLAAGQHLLIVADLSMPAMGPQMMCLGDAGPMTCYYAGFGISAPRGERIYLLTAAGSEVTHGDIPPNAATTGRSWGRLPDGTGDFMLTAETPGRANAAP